METTEKKLVQVAHTPAPWSVRYKGGIDYIIIADNYGTICESLLPNSDLSIIDEYESQQYANAKLIAAAPELLQCLRNCMHVKAHKVSVDAMRQMIQSVIKKATE